MNGGGGGGGGDDDDDVFCAGCRRHTTRLLFLVPTQTTQTSQRNRESSSASVTCSITSCTVRHLLWAVDDSCQLHGEYFQCVTIAEDEEKEAKEEWH
jgi:hypothetical protein